MCVPKRKETFWIHFLFHKLSAVFSEVLNVVVISLNASLLPLSQIFVTNSSSYHYLEPWLPAFACAMQKALTDSVKSFLKAVGDELLNITP